MASRIVLPDEKISNFCHRNRIRKLALFGSALREDFWPDSDVDVLVEFRSDARVGFFELYDMEQELSEILGRRKIDLNTPKSLSKHFRDAVLAEAEVKYVESRPDGASSSCARVCAESGFVNIRERQA
jgi:uncharacterized protein